MSQFAKSILFLGVLSGMMLYSFADKGGVRKKSKSKIALNITTSSTFKNTLSLNLKTGLKYKGMLYAGVQKQKSNLVATNLITYQKGNTVYILPTKHKVVIPEMRQGYTGVKLILKTKN